MLKINKVSDEIYICNHCGKTFNKLDACINKGNLYLCSIQCVLEYEEASHDHA